jgi:hypothetical protein
MIYDLRSSVGMTQLNFEITRDDLSSEISFEFSEEIDFIVPLKRIEHAN